jgi:hypothetical protein
MKFSVIYVKQVWEGYSPACFFAENQPVIFHFLPLIGQKFGLGSGFE